MTSRGSRWSRRGGGRRFGQKRRIPSARPAASEPAWVCEELRRPERRPRAHHLFRLERPDAGQVVGGTVDGPASDLFGLQDRLAENVAEKLRLPRPVKTTAPPTGLETGNEQERYLQALGALQRYDRPASIERALVILEALAKERPDFRAGAGRPRADRDREVQRDTRSRLDQGSLRRGREGPPGRRLGARGRGNRGRATAPDGAPREAVAAFERALAAQPEQLRRPPRPRPLLRRQRRRRPRRGDLQASGEAPAVLLRRLQQARPGSTTTTGASAKPPRTSVSVAEMTPDNAKAFANLGGVLMQLGRLDQALEVFRRSVALAPTDLAWSNIGTLEYYEAAFHLGRRRRTRRPSSCNPTITRHGRTSATPGCSRDRSAERPPRRTSVRPTLSRKELETNPEDGHVRSYLARALAKLGKTAEAREQGSRALQIAPEQPGVPLQRRRGGETSGAASGSDRGSPGGRSSRLQRGVDPQRPGVLGASHRQGFSASRRDGPRAFMISR